MSETAQPEKRAKRKFTPTIKVWCDDLAITDDETGEVYYPHLGEWVLFRKTVPMAVLSTLGEIQACQKLDPRKDYEKMLDAGSQLIDVLLGQIVDWSLTSNEIDEKATKRAQKDDPDADPIYVPFPKPSEDRAGAREVLMQAESYLTQYLQAHMMDGQKVPNTSNLPSPSL